MRSKRIEDYIQSHSEIKIYGEGTRCGQGTLCAREFQAVQAYKPNELYMTVGAGMRVDELTDILAKNGQRLACEVQDHRVIFQPNREDNAAPTIGGAIGLNAYGSGRLRYGMLRDAVLGLRFYDGQGTYLRTGGIVMKNVTGLDLTKFFVGSRGRLGIATEVTLKVLPQPLAQEALSFEAPLEDVRRIMGKLLRKPLDIFAAQYQNGRIFLRLEGQDLQSSKRAIFDEVGGYEDCDLSVWNDLRDWRDFQNESEIWRFFGATQALFDMAKRAQSPFAILQGGQELLICENPKDGLNPPHGVFGICEKGQCRGAVFPARSPSSLALRQKVRQIFDPLEKFGKTL